MSLTAKAIARLTAFHGRLHARADSEHEQALIRILIAAIVWVYLRWSYSPTASNAHDQFLILWLLGIDLIVCALIFAHIAWRPGVNRARRFVGMVNDAGMSTLVMFLTGEAGASMIGLFLFITFGNGFRYGRSYLFACQALCIAGYAAVLMFHDHWQLHQTVGWSLMVALVILPVYVSTLLKRIEQARARAEEANRAKSTFLANMSHEMRTPLNGIVGAIDLFKTTPLDARQSELTRLLQHSVGMLRALVDDVLDIEKIEAGRLTIELADFDLHATLNGLINLMRSHARNKGLRLTAMVDPAIDYHLRGDAHHLTQILLNLVSNAIKFTEAGAIDVIVTKKAETTTGYQLRFEVRDSGIGMSEVAQARIFERFVQADDSTTRKYGGTGLGTTIAKQLVELMGGHIGCMSKTGVGSTFWFEIPLLHAEDASAAQVSAEPDAGAVLLVATAEDQSWLRGMAAVISSEQLTADPTEDVEQMVAEFRARGSQLSAVFFTGEIERAKQVFAQLAADASNASTALIYITSMRSATNGVNALREIEGVNLIERDAPARYVRNAIHAATSKPADKGQVIDLRAVLEEQREKLKILVAEDNTTNQQIIRELLSKAGHEVVIGNDGEMALDLYESANPDLAILDFNMPYRNGLEVTKAIRVMEGPGEHLPIMILSASVTPEARERARSAGADEFVGKPYEAAILLQTIDRMARRRKSSRADDGSPASIAPAEVTRLVPRASPIIDVGRLDEVRRIAGTSDFLSRLVEGFDSDIRRLLGEVADVLRRGNLTAVGDLTHAMKGAALGIGAVRFGEICSELECAAREGNASLCAAAFERLGQCFPETSQQLRRSPGVMPLAANR